MVTAADTTRSDSALTSLWQRQLLAFHYERGKKLGAGAFEVSELIRKQLGPIGLALVGTEGWRRTALYVFERTDIGFRFRAKLPEVDGKTLIALVQRLAPTVHHHEQLVKALGELGLSYREIALGSGVDETAVRRQLSEW